MQSSSWEADSQLVKKCSVFYGTWKFIIMFGRVCHWTLSWPSWSHSNLHTLFLCLCFPVSFLSWGFLINIVCSSNFLYVPSLYSLILTVMFKIYKIKHLLIMPKHRYGRSVVIQPFKKYSIDLDPKVRFLWLQKANTEHCLDISI